VQEAGEAGNEVPHIASAPGPLDTERQEEVAGESQRDRLRQASRGVGDPKCPFACRLDRGARALVEDLTTEDALDSLELGAQRILVQYGRTTSRVRNQVRDQL
jgi:hypothetical protein